jgi:hypothetical protein
VPGDPSLYVGQFEPIPELRAAGADVGLVFLSANDIVYQTPTSDALYAAQAPIRATMGYLGRNLSREFWVRDEPARVLGCASRFQFCDASGGGHTSGGNASSSSAGDGSGCTPLVGLPHALLLARRLWRANRRQARVFEWVTSALAMDPLDVWNVPRALGQAALTARYSLSNGLQGALAADQWQREAQYWFMTSLANMQRIVLETATGPLDPQLNSMLVRPATAEEHLLCRSQVGLSLSPLFSLSLSLTYYTRLSFSPPVSSVAKYQ